MAAPTTQQPEVILNNNFMCLVEFKKAKYQDKFDIFEKHYRQLYIVSIRSWTTEIVSSYITCFKCITSAEFIHVAIIQPLCHLFKRDLHCCHLYLADHIEIEFVTHSISIHFKQH